MRSLVLTAALLAGFQNLPASAEPMKIEVRHLADSVSGPTRFLNSDYVVAAPAAGNVSDKTPLLIFLHG